MIRYIRNFFFQITGNPGIRFRKYDKPTEQSFRQLFDSIGFLKESSDTSMLNQQGFTKIATDSNAVARNSTVDADLFTKGVLPHMLPNVLPGTNISVIPQTNVVGRTGGLGLDFVLNNTMVVAPALTVGNPIIITQVGPGSNVLVDFNQAILAPLFNCISKVLTDIGDPTCDYFPNKIDIPANNVVFPFLSHDRLNKNTNLITHEFELSYKDKIGEVSMFTGSNLQYSTQFVAGYGQGQWKNWVVCDGSSYNNSLGNPVLTADMRGVTPMGYGSAGAHSDGVNYTVIGSEQDATLASGLASVTLTKAQIPKHKHQLDADGASVTTSNPGVHNHNVPDLTLSFLSGGASPDAIGAANPPALSGTTFAGAHTHTLFGATGDGTTDGLLGDAHENRPPFIVVVFVQFVG